MRILRVVALCLLVSAASLRATVLIPADLTELARDARAIAVGRVVGLDSRWSPDHQTIETIVSLEVAEYLKGSLGATVAFRIPGGRVGRYRNIVEGAPQFSIDQPVIVFLGARGPSVPFVLGMSQGVYRIVPAAGGLGWDVTSEPLRRRQALPDFKARVRDLVERAR